jgi:hypothetical protein
MFARGFRNHGYIPLTTYLRTYKIGDYVDIKVNGAIHKVQATSSAWGAWGLLAHFMPWFCASSIGRFAVLVGCLDGEFQSLVWVLAAIAGYAPQVVPGQDWHCLERDQARSGC